MLQSCSHHIVAESPLMSCLKLPPNCSLVCLTVRPLRLAARWIGDGCAAEKISYVLMHYVSGIDAGVTRSSW